MWSIYEIIIVVVAVVMLYRLSGNLTLQSVYQIMWDNLPAIYFADSVSGFSKVKGEGKEKRRKEKRRKALPPFLSSSEANVCTTQLIHYWTDYRRIHVSVCTQHMHTDVRNIGLQILHASLPYINWNSAFTLIIPLLLLRTERHWIENVIDKQFSLDFSAEVLFYTHLLFLILLTRGSRFIQGQT